MSLINWLSLITLLLLILTAGLPNNTSYHHPDWCTKTLVYPRLCAKKMRLKDAQVGDLALIDGISLKKARLLITAIKQEPETSFIRLQAVKGIGPKTIAKLALNFRP